MRMRPSSNVKKKQIAKSLCFFFYFFGISIEKSNALWYNEHVYMY